MNAQKHRKSKLSEDVDLPVDFALDYQLGLTERGKIRGSSALLENTAYNEAGTTVFTKLVQNPSVAQDLNMKEPESARYKAAAWFLFESERAFFFACSEAGVDAEKLRSHLKLCQREE